jgi:hypothetical protein
MSTNANTEIEEIETNSINLLVEINKIAAVKKWNVQDEIDALERLVASCGSLSFKPTKDMFIMYEPKKVFGRPTCRAMEVTLFLSNSELKVRLHGKHDGFITTWPRITENVGGIGAVLKLIEEHDGGRLSGTAYSRTVALQKVYSKIPSPIPGPTEVELLEKLRLAAIELTEVKSELMEAKSIISNVKTAANRIGRRLNKVNRLGPMTNEELHDEYISMKAAFKTEIASNGSEQSTDGDTLSKSDGEE